MLKDCLPSCSQDSLPLLSSRSDESAAVGLAHRSTLLGVPPSLTAASELASSACALAPSTGELLDVEHRSLWLMQLASASTSPCSEGEANRLLADGRDGGGEELGA